MNGVTYAQLARSLGCSKPYVIKLCRTMDPTGEHVDSTGNTHVVDAWLASAVSAEAERRRRTPKGGDGGAVEAVTDAQRAVRHELETVWAARVADMEAAHAEVMAEARARADALAAEVADLRARLDAEREAHEVTRGRLMRAEGVAAEALACRWPWQLARIRRRSELPWPRRDVE